MSHEDLKKGLELIYKHFGRFGLEMRIGRSDSPSKKECVFFPPPILFYSHLPVLQQSSISAGNAIEDKNNDIDINDKEHHEEKVKTKLEREGLLYDELEETTPITVADGLVTFCRHFMFLGSFISFSLCDDFDIKNRVTAATDWF